MKSNLLFRWDTVGGAYDMEDHRIGVEVDAEDYRSIKEAQAFVKKGSKKGIYAVKLWGSVFAFEHGEGPIEEIVKTQHEAMVVQDTTVHWTYYVKHVDGKQWETEPLMISELDKFFKKGTK